MPGLEWKGVFIILLRKKFERFVGIEESGGCFLIVSRKKHALELHYNSIRASGAAQERPSKGLEGGALSIPYFFFKNTHVY